MSTKINENKTKIYIFWSIIALLTITFIAVLITIFVQYKPIESYEDLRKSDMNLIGQEMFTQNYSEYYVYIYNSNQNNNNKATELQPAVFNYFNFVKRYSKKENIIRIYGLDVNFIENRSCLGTENIFTNVRNFSDFKVKESNVPVLVRIYQGQIDTVDVTVNDIHNELQLAMNKYTN
ncbi:MAG TPA: hypothetical protein GXZ48_04925 [Acholeplasmataceae bacterium]|jgi:hypothetical protein|nr:hypothetical protein [Acholeplasmataceae bacterium]